MSSHFLQISQVSKYFGDKGNERCVLSNINLDVHPKEFICLLGPSGCGKSTLLKLMGEKKAFLYAESLKKNILNKLGKHGKNARELINTINFIFERKF